MDYLTPTLGKTNTIQLPELLKRVTFDFKHGFLYTLENNMFSGTAHEDSISVSVIQHIKILVIVFWVWYPLLASCWLLLVFCCYWDYNIVEFYFNHFEWHGLI